MTVSDPLRCLELESPGTLAAIGFDDEADELLVKSSSTAALNVVQSCVSILMTDPDFMERCIAMARQVSGVGTRWFIKQGEEE